VSVSWRSHAESYRKLFRSGTCRFGQLYYKQC